MFKMNRLVVNMQTDNVPVNTESNVEPVKLNNSEQVVEECDFQASEIPVKTEHDDFTDNMEENDIDVPSKSVKLNPFHRKSEYSVEVNTAGNWSSEEIIDKNVKTVYDSVKIEPSTSADDVEENKSDLTKNKYLTKVNEQCKALLEFKVSDNDLAVKQIQNVAASKEESGKYCKIRLNFVDSGVLKLHSRILAGKGPFKCRQCAAAFAQPGDLYVHLSTHTRKKYRYNECDKIFTSPSQLKIHRRIHTGEKPFKCSQCDAAFARATSLKTHLIIHTGGKPFKCNQCESAFTHAGNLCAHFRIHTGEKPFKCSQCDAAFARTNTLKAHFRIHTGEKPFKCSRCDAAFAQASTLKKHSRICTGEKPFAQISDLKNHSRIYTGERPFKCSQCDAAFARANSLKTHFRTHTGERPFKCSQCDAAFARADTLKVHLRIHTR